MNNMMLIREMYNNEPSFKMIPLSNDCPYLEAAFDSQARQLVIRHRDKLSVFQMFERLDDNGHPIPIQGKKIPEGSNPHKLQRIQFDGNVTYKISHVDDITLFMTRFLVQEDQYAIDLLFPKLTEEQLAEFAAKRKEAELANLGPDLQQAPVIMEIPDAQPKTTE